MMHINDIFWENFIYTIHLSLYELNLSKSKPIEFYKFYKPIEIIKSRKDVISRIEREFFCKIES